MSFVYGHYDLSNYTTREELQELLYSIEEDLSILRSYLRGVEEKLQALEEEKNES